MAAVTRRLCAAWRHVAAPAITGAVLALPLLGAPAPGRAQEQIEQQEPTPSAVEQVATPIERSFVPAPAPQPFVLLPELRERLKDAPAFFPTGPGRPWGWQEPRDWAAYGQWMYGNHLLKQQPVPGREMTNDLLPGQG